MNLHNRPFPTETEQEQPDTVFNTLRVGDRYNNGNLVWKRDDNSITVKCRDNWFRTTQKGDWAWERLVKLERKRK